MEGLWGSLKTMPLEDLAMYLAHRRLSGTVRCEQGPTQKSMVVRDGKVIIVSSNDPREYLGQFLINYGHINEEQLSQAFATQKETGVFLGRILVMIGLVDEHVVRDVLSMKVRETVLSLMEWVHGSFHFAEGEVADDDPAIGVAVDLKDLQQEAAFRKTAWAAIRPVFPHGDLLLRIDPGKVPDPPEHPLDGRIISLASQGQTIDEIALSLHATPFALYQRLYALYRREAVGPIENADAAEVEEVEIEWSDGDAPAHTPVPEILGREAPVAEIVERAIGFLQQGKYSEAQMVAARAAELSPDDASAQTVLKEAETGLLADLRHQLLTNPVAPRVTAAPDKLRALRFTPAERYLLKRFDGRHELAEILKVSPIKEVEGLKLVRKLLDAGIIDLQPMD